MKIPLKLLAGAAALVALSARRNKEEEESEEAREEETAYAMTGFAPTDAYERELLERRPVDLAAFEDIEPNCGSFYQARRGDTWLGGHERSITYRALFRFTFVHATLKGRKDAEALARKNAENPALRKALFDLCVSQRWADELYATYMVSSKDPVGPTGRGIPLARSCAGNRQRILDGEAPVRLVPRGVPSDRGLGVPNRKTLHGTRLGDLRLSLPYLWICMLDPDALLDGRVTTKGVRWHDGASGLEPPPEVVRLQMAVLK